MRISEPSGFFRMIMLTSSAFLLFSREDRWPVHRGSQGLERLLDQALAKFLLVVRIEGGIADHVRDGLAPHDAVRSDRLRERVQGTDLHHGNALGLDLLRRRGAAAVAGPSGGGQ